MVRWRIEVDDTREVVHMNAPCHDIGGDESIGPSLGKGIERTLTLPLGPIAMHRDRTNALCLKLADDPVGALSLYDRTRRPGRAVPRAWP